MAGDDLTPDAVLLVAWGLTGPGWSMTLAELVDEASPQLSYVTKKLRCVPVAAPEWAVKPIEEWDGPRPHEGTEYDLFLTCRVPVIRVGKIVGKRPGRIPTDFFLEYPSKGLHTASNCIRLKVSASNPEQRKEQ